jgi:hypothetical protein
MSLKIDMMVNHLRDHLRENNKNWKIMTKGMIISYLKDKFKCSPYMARKVVEKLFNNE